MTMTCSIGVAVAVPCANAAYGLTLAKSVAAKAARRNELIRSDPPKLSDDLSSAVGSRTPPAIRKLRREGDGPMTVWLKLLSGGRHSDRVEFTVQKVRARRNAGPVRSRLDLRPEGS